MNRSHPERSRGISALSVGTVTGKAQRSLDFARDDGGLVQHDEFHVHS